MNDFRRSISRRAQQKAIDGIINAPTRPAPSAEHGERSFGRSSATDRLRARHVDNFKRPDGFHATVRSNQGHGSAASPVAPTMPAPGRARDTSLLQSTLSANAKPKRRGLLGKRDHKSSRSKRGKHPVRKWVLRTSLGLVVIVLLIGGFLFTKGYLKLHKVFKGGGQAAALKADVSPSLLKGEGDGRINIMLLGIGGPGHDGPDLTDTILLASIDPINKTASLVSVPRDLWVTTSGSSKINAVYANAKYHALSVSPKDTAGAQKAGVTATEKVVSQVLGVPIHYYGIVDFQAFQQAIDTVGGIDINVGPNDAVTEMLWNPATRKNFYLHVTPGQQHFNGERALFYARSRHTSARGDFDRSERQRLIIEALSAKVLSAGTYTNPVKLSQLMSAFGDHVSTDMSLGDSVRLLQISKGITGKISSLDLAKPDGPLVNTGMIGNQSVVLPVAGAGNYTAINAYVRNQLRDGYLAKENANVTVLNGTETPGLATLKATELKSYGYNVGTVGDAPTHAYTKTVIVDRTNGKDKYTQNYLEKRFGVKAVRTLPDTSIQPGTANFVIILGQDIQP